MNKIIPTGKAFALLAEDARRKIIANVTEQYTEEAKYNYEQYIRSMHAAVLALDEEEIKKALVKHTQEQSKAVVNWISEKYGKKETSSNDPMSDVEQIIQEMLS